MAKVAMKNPATIEEELAEVHRRRAEAEERLRAAEYELSSGEEAEHQARVAAALGRPAPTVPDLAVVRTAREEAEVDLRALEDAEKVVSEALLRAQLEACVQRGEKITNQLRKIAGDYNELQHRMADVDAAMTKLTTQARQLENEFVEILAGLGLSEYEVLGERRLVYTPFGRQAWREDLAKDVRELHFGVEF